MICVRADCAVPFALILLLSRPRLSPLPVSSRESREWERGPEKRIQVLLMESAEAEELLSTVLQGALGKRDRRAATGAERELSSHPGAVDAVLRRLDSSTRGAGLSSQHAQTLLRLSALVAPRVDAASFGRLVGLQAVVLAALTSSAPRSRRRAHSSPCARRALALTLPPSQVAAALQAPAAARAAAGGKLPGGHGAAAGDAAAVRPGRQPGGPLPQLARLRRRARARAASVPGAVRQGCAGRRRPTAALRGALPARCVAQHVH